jgi:hypothetical protein
MESMHGVEANAPGDPDEVTHRITNRESLYPEQAAQLYRDTETGTQPSTTSTEPGARLAPGSPDLLESSCLRDRAAPDAFLRSVYQTRWTGGGGIGVHIAQCAVDPKADPVQQRLRHGGNGLVR